MPKFLGYFEGGCLIIGGAEFFMTPEYRMQRKTSVMKHLMIPLLLFALCNCALAQSKHITPAFR